MRPHMMLSLSAANTSRCYLLRQSLTVLVQLQPSKTLPPPPPNPTLSSFLRPISCSHTPLASRHGCFSPRSTPLRRFSTRATHNLNEHGSIDLPLMQSMEKKIKEQLNAESVIVKDAYGDGRHVSIDVVSTAFEGQSAVNRQRMVYKAIWEELQTTVHAVDQMTTTTPDEAAARNDKSS